MPFGTVKSNSQLLCNLDITSLHFDVGNLYHQFIDMNIRTMPLKQEVYYSLAPMQGIFPIFAVQKIGYVRL